jgi:hypothetical protein
MSKDWLAWHGNYRTSPRLRQRLQIVQEYISSCLQECPPGPIRVVSLCAGDGRDLIGALFDHPRAGDVQARLVELDQRLVECGRTAAESAALGAQLEFVQGDATLSSTYKGAVPADLVVVCGVFGNIPNETELHRLIQNIRCLCKTGAFTIWTRDLIEDGERRLTHLREFFGESAFEEVSFKMTLIGNTGVGIHRYLGQPLALPDDEQLFVFSNSLEPEEP